MFDAWSGATREVEVTLYTDAFVIRGRVQSTQRRLSDVLNFSDSDFLVVSEATFEALGDRSNVHRAPFAQVNLAAVLFAVADAPAEPAPELRQRKMPAPALISIPPYRVTGRIHLPPHDDLRSALVELGGRFVPVTDATFVAEQLGEPAQGAPMVAVNHSRAQILSPYGEDAAVAPWEAEVARTSDAPDAAEPAGTAAAG